MDIFNELLDWCKNNCDRTTETYYEDITHSLSYYSTPISSQSSCFVRSLLYHVNYDEQIIWIYCGKGKNLFTDNAAAITIKCNKQNAIYSYYKILADEPDIDEDEAKYWECINNWHANNYILDFISIKSAIDRFNAYANTNIKISFEDTKASLKDFIYKINESNKLTIQSEYENIEDFLKSDQSELKIICIDTKLPIIKINKNYNEYLFIVDIITDNGDNFVIKSKLSEKISLTKMINDTVDALRLYEQFSKYADDLEQCL